MSTPSPSPGPNPNAAQSFSWAFSVDPNAASAADSQFTTFDQKLTDADINIRGAKDLINRRCVSRPSRTITRISPTYART